MPRKRKTPSGEVAQTPPKSVPGVRYGEGVQQQAMASAMPAVDRMATPPMTGAAPGPPTGAAPPPGGAPIDIAGAMASLGQAPVGGLLASSFPDEPVTAGLPTGPGPGPEAVRPGRSPLARTLENLYRASGDPVFYNMAKKAGL